jgi:hypothetical protein
MPRTKQSLKRRSRPHRKETLALRKRKNRLKAKRRSARHRPHRRQGTGRGLKQR